MIIRNDFDIPEALVNVITKGIQKPSINSMRVTELINPPIVKVLALKHWDEIVVDVSDYLFSVLGQAVHYILEKGTPEDAIGEERISADLGIHTISGKSDLYHHEGIEDWKVTSVFSFLLGLKEEWEAQLNVYAFLWEDNGFPVKSLKVNAILRDWMRGKARFEANYPQIPFISYKVPIWNESKRWEYIQKRLRIHSLEPIECTPYEKWERPTTYAVMKMSAKRATRVLDTELKAKEYIDEMKDEKAKKLMTIQKRIGERVKCNDYCLIRDFCPYNKE